jgi:hypothetical protein
VLIGTTEFDIFSIDPSTCDENWRTHEEYPAYILPTNRGAAYLDGRLFRGTDDGRVLAYDFKTGKRLWETTIADVKKGESVPAALRRLLTWGSCNEHGNLRSAAAETGRLRPWTRLPGSCMCALRFARSMRATSAAGMRYSSRSRHAKATKVAKALPRCSLALF